MFDESGPYRIGVPDGSRIWSATPLAVEPGFTDKILLTLAVVTLSVSVIRTFLAAAVQLRPMLTAPLPAVEPTPVSALRATGFSVTVEEGVVTEQAGVEMVVASLGTVTVNSCFPVPAPLPV